MGSRHPLNTTERTKIITGDIHEVDLVAVTENLLTEEGGIEVGLPRQSGARAHLIMLIVPDRVNGQRLPQIVY